MPPVGYAYYFGHRAQPDAKSPAGEPDRSITDTSGRSHNVARGVLLMTIVAGVPVLIAAIFLLLFKF